MKLFTYALLLISVLGLNVAHADDIFFCDLLLSGETRAQLENSLKQNLFGQAFTLAWQARGLTPKAKAIFDLDLSRHPGLILAHANRQSVGDETKMSIRLLQYHTDHINDREAVSFLGGYPILWREAALSRRDLNRTQDELTERFRARFNQIQNLSQVQVGYRRVLQGDDEKDPLAIYAVVSKMLSQMWLTLGLEIDCEDAANYTEITPEVRVIGVHERCLVPVARFTRMLHSRR